MFWGWPYTYVFLAIKFSFFWSRWFYNIFFELLLASKIKIPQDLESATINAQIIHILFVAVDIFLLRIAKLQKWPYSERLKMITKSMSMRQSLQYSRKGQRISCYRTKHLYVEYTCACVCVKLSLQLCSQFSSKNSRL